MISDSRSGASLLAWALRSARQHTLALVRDVDAGDGVRQATAGERHPVWILGHLLLGDVYLLSLLQTAPLPPDFHALLSAYGPGAAPTDTAGAYAPMPRLVDRLTRTGELRFRAVQDASPEELSRATPDDVLVQTQPTLAHHLQALVFHEGYHGGQLAAWRRNHGLAPVPWVFAPGASGEA
ncbi:MAG TPA: DinB family protein [Candidatus Eisenbacteria bacterium]